MKNSEQTQEHLDAFLETSSVLAHDISGQNHVAQFCIEELAQHVQGDAQKYISRLKSSLDEISELTGLYRRIVRSQNPKNFPKSWADAHGVIEGLIHLHYFKDKNLFVSRFEDTHSLARVELAANCYSLLQIVYASYVLFVDAFKLEFLEVQPVLAVISDLTSDVGVQLRVAGNGDQLNQLQELIDQEGPFVGKTLRRTIAMESFKKALKGEQEAVRISFYKQDDYIGINLILKKVVR